MSVRLFFSEGLRFRDILSTMKDFCGFEPDPVGALLGEEPTRHSDFTEAGCSGQGTFSSIAERVSCGVTGWSLNEYNASYASMNNSLCIRWNPNKDSLIHEVAFGFRDYNIYPEKKGAWKETWDDSKQYAPRLYSIYKDLFVKFRCDEAQILDENLTPLVHWVRSANYQSVIADYEFGRELSREQAYAGMWRRLMPTKEVFPEIEEEYENKYKEMLDLRVDW